MFPEAGEEVPVWYAVQTRPRHEKKVALELERSRVETFLPLVQEMHSWSDRRKRVDVPLFSCYVFVRLASRSRQRATVAMTSGVVAFVGNNGGTPIPGGEIEAVRSVVALKVPIERCGLSRGQRVRVRGGVLDGVEGFLLSEPQERRLLVSVGAIHQSLSVSLHGYEVEAV